MVHQKIERRSIQEGGSTGSLTGNCSADHSKNTGTDDRPNPECGQGQRPQRLFQACLGILRVKNQLVDGFRREDLFRQNTLLQVRIPTIGHSARKAKNLCTDFLNGRDPSLPNPPRQNRAPGARSAQDGGLK